MDGFGMPAINLDFTDDDYERVRVAADRERLPLKSFARTAVLARLASSPTTWALATDGAETFVGLSDAAKEMMQNRRGRSPQDGNYRANGCLWLHLSEPAAVIAYPTAHYTSSGIFEFLLDRAGVAAVLDSWSAEDGLRWEAGDANGQAAASNLAVAIGNRRLGIPQ
jgi:hypothetical protein